MIFSALLFFSVLYSYAQIIKFKLVLVHIFKTPFISWKTDTFSMTLWDQYMIFGVYKAFWNSAWEELHSVSNWYKLKTNYFLTWKMSIFFPYNGEVKPYFTDMKFYACLSFICQVVHKRAKTCSGLLIEFHLWVCCRYLCIKEEMNKLMTE